MSVSADSISFFSKLCSNPGYALRYSRSSTHDPPESIVKTAASIFFHAVFLCCSFVLGIDTRFSFLSLQSGYFLTPNAGLLGLFLFHLFFLLESYLVFLFVMTPVKSTRNKGVIPMFKHLLMSFSINKTLHSLSGRFVV